MKTFYTLLILLIPFVGFGQCISGNCENGQGTMTGYNGSKYVGEWKNGTRNGQGTYTFENGDKYVGEWKDGWKHGQGTYTSPHVGEYVGEWKDDYLNGQGTMTYSHGGEYVGEYKDGMLNGQGTYTFSNGSKYVGEFKDGLRHGLGSYYMSNGVGINYLYRNDHFLDVKKHIKEIVEQKINEWQEKGEFEKTSTFLLRVNEKTRDIKINSFQDEAISGLKQEYIKLINISDFKLGDYDADNETFLIEHNLLVGNYIIPVPLNEARYFKENFLKAGIRNIKCYLNENEFILSNFEISIWPSNQEPGEIAIDYIKRVSEANRNIYEYNLANSVEYKISEIDYNFSAIELDDIESTTNNLNLINTNKISVGSSEVDIDIPKNNKVKNRYAIIIGNENYSSFQKTLEKEQDVPFAVNDANTFKKYALETLGVEEENLFFLENATSGQMNQTIDLVTKIVNKLGKKAELIFYYAGHGFPDELTKEPYLIPVDVSSSYLNNAISLDELYEKFSKTGAKKVLAFVDACFSGGARENSLLASRGVKINPKMTDISNNLVVFSASSETQSALPYNEENHGMFTFYLLKKIKESKGKITLGELFDYVSEEVSLNSLKINQKEQDPNVIFSPKIENKWRSWEIY